jgi:surface polysaccharide O-acyltransferase-like enzyme
MLWLTTITTTTTISTTTTTTTSSSSINDDDDYYYIAFGLIGIVILSIFLLNKMAIWCNGPVWGNDKWTANLMNDINIRFT